MYADFFSGLIRKCVIADNCAVLANAVFVAASSALQIFGLLLWELTRLTWRFMETSGYSDIAREAPMLGFHFMVNFRRPSSQSPSGFWRRWHISLSTCFAITCTFLSAEVLMAMKTSRNSSLHGLAGFWHGANDLRHLAAIHGVVLAVERLLFPG